MAKKKDDRVLLGYTGSWTFGMSSFARMGELKDKLKKNPRDKKAKKELEKIKKKRSGHATPVYVSREKYKKLKEWSELEYLSGFSG